MSSADLEYMIGLLRARHHLPGELVVAREAEADELLLVMRGELSVVDGSAGRRLATVSAG